MTFTPTFLLIATGKYIQFVNQCRESIQKYFPNAIIYLFSDHDGNFTIKHEKWPFVTLYRFHYFLEAEKHIVGDYLYFMDIDARFVDYPDIQGDLVAVRHCGYYFRKPEELPQETNKKSVFYNYRFKKYYGGGFFGGKREEFFKLARWCKAGIETDINREIIARNNDETAMNAYFTLYPPTLELSPDYHYPETTEYFERECWNGTNPFKPKILLLDKNHEEIRK